MDYIDLWPTLYFPRGADDPRDSGDDLQFFDTKHCSIAFMALVLLCSYTLFVAYGEALLTVVYPCVVVENYTLRWRRLLVYAGQSYRTSLLSFAWLFQARPLYIVCLFTCLYIISKGAITSPMKRQLRIRQMM